MLTEEMIDELREAASCEGSELGEYWKSMIIFYEEYNKTYSEDVFGLPSKLKTALEVEILEEYNFLKENFQIVEEEITTVTVVRRLNEL